MSYSIDYVKKVLINRKIKINEWLEDEEYIQIALKRLKEHNLVMKIKTLPRNDEFLYFEV